MKLDHLFIQHGTDKSSSHHNYSPVYEKILAPVRNDHLVVLILGIGGYEYTDRGGGDLKAFEEYLPNAKIYGIDIYDKSFLNSHRIKTFVGSQDDEKFLEELIDKICPPDIIIDDASHVNSKTIRAFNILFPYLWRGGKYIIEDVHTSYWSEVASDGTDFEGGFHSGTVMNYFKALTDALNKNATKEVRQGLKGFASESFLLRSISFYEKMIIIERK